MVKVKENNNPRTGLENYDPARAGTYSVHRVHAYSSFHKQPDLSFKSMLGCNVKSSHIFLKWGVELENKYKCMANKAQVS